MLQAEGPPDRRTQHVDRHELAHRAVQGVLRRELPLGVGEPTRIVHGERRRVALGVVVHRADLAVAAVVVGGVEPRATLLLAHALLAALLRAVPRARELRVPALGQPRRQEAVDRHGGCSSVSDGHPGDVPVWHPVGKVLHQHPTRRELAGERGGQRKQRHWTAKELDT
eukprot:4172019-Prymnesium_polylepis.1